MRNLPWSAKTVVIGCLLAACSSSPGSVPELTPGEPPETDTAPIGQLLTGTVTVTRHNVQTGPGASLTEEGTLRLEIRLKPDPDNESSWVDAGSSYSYTGSYVNHSAQAEIPHCVTDDYSDITGSGAVGSGLTIYGGPLGNEMRLTVSAQAHGTGHNQTVCDLGPVDLLTGDTSDDTTVRLGCPDSEDELVATGTPSTGYDFACTVQSAMGEGQIVVTGVVGPP